MLDTATERGLDSMSRIVQHRNITIAASMAATLLAGLAVAAATPATAVTTDLTSIKINEVESNSDAINGDWIELKNEGSDTVNIGGAILSDNDNTHKHVIAANTLLPVGGIIAFRVDDTAVQGNFGLGASDSARLFPAGTTNLGSTTPVDSYTWTTHAPTTYGRNQNKTGAPWEVTAVGTFGSSNVFPGAAIVPITGIKISEIESNGDATDWIELYNSSPAGLRLDGAILSDSDNGHIFVIPDDTEIESGQYLAFDVSSSFGLGASDSARLFARNDIALTTLVDSHSWTSHATTTYAKDFAGDQTWKTSTTPTKNAANDFGPRNAPDLTGVKINEVETHGDDTNGDWVELVNTGSTTANLSGAIISDNNNNHIHRIIDGVTLAPGAVKAFRVDNPATPGNFGLGDNDSARLFKADALNLATDTPVDSRSWTTHAKTTYGLKSDGAWAATNKGTFDGVNDFTSAPVYDISYVVLNEVQSNDTPDWVELKNTAPVSVTITGASLIDNDPINPVVTIGDVTIPAGGYHTVDLSSADPATFGLGRADSIQLFRAGVNPRTAGSIPVDHFSWEDHGNKTWGRTADGLGDWANTTSATKGSANQF